MVSDVSPSRGVRMLSSCLGCDAEPLSLFLSVAVEFITLAAHQNIQKHGPRVSNQTSIGEPVQPNRSAAM